ncbi:MAG: sugar transferase [Lentisphaerae bacterium]|nr:sugar transferase [Lentisphaerota bacterium]
MTESNTTALFELYRRGRGTPSPWERWNLLFPWSSAGRRWMLWDIYVGWLAAWSAFNFTPYGPQPHGLSVGIGFGLLMGLSCWLCGVPQPESNFSRYEAMAVGFMGVLLGMALCMFAGFVVAYEKIGRWIWFLFGVFSYLGILTPRLIVSRLDATVRHRLLIYGAGSAGRALAEAVGRYPGVQIVGFLDDDRSLWNRCFKGIPCLGGIEQAEPLCRSLSVEFISVAVTRGIPDERAAQLLRLRHCGVEIMDLPDLYGRLMARVPIDHIPASWLVSGERISMRSMLMFAKRLFDILLSLIGLALTLPVWPLIALGIKLAGPGPVFFRQWRLGWRRRPFRILKFRTMISDAEEDGARWADKADPRATPLGRFLRVTRLDELPQLLNVLKGDMTLIGPRPERPEFIADIEKQVPFYDQRFLVFPGLTGWAQVCYRYGASMEDAKRKLEYDLFYIRNISFRLDLQILMRTVVLLMKGSR